MARVPKKRNGLSDSLRYTLQCFVFLDDTRKLAHLHSLLTRFGNLSCVHVACTKSAEGKTSNAEQERKNKHISDMLSCVCDLVDSRSSNNEHTAIAHKLTSIQN